MRSYTLFIEDDRYTTPTLVFIEAGTDSRAQEIAIQQLKASPHHRAAELRAGDDFVFSVSRDTPPDPV